ncbi:cation:proton antiporter [Streptomyces ipomoeae]|uniref:Transporter, CPA2 family n=1 Tax=Streptomyces ipomoeae 91-03 TaxID=698759 RepID=L1KUU5_9ACTN|nr:cation:proton antiporter [Streptomyces ipomoeae]EKX64168.1 transporter, CPA2 family [Streptomyces ipomoeae 91-03]MDX2695388.1 cation:proton antiporter [Streptomyces ipomoeae]MDX2823222.1 cation:proton antiporter [Streptomyces ipomoeae]MDX2845396.1 cation:proton antiporter [Streptomyces ipomoeae]MDX2875807.1 cation:proton antiporter [Streptomyces ipomoeae]
MTQDTIVAHVVGAVAVISALAVLLGGLARRLGQPPVVGQILAGIAMGPSVLGHLPGGIDTLVVPHEIIPYLSVLAQIGLVLFMFSVGYEMDLGLLRGTARGVATISAGSFLLPMLLGAGLALVIGDSAPQEGGLGTFTFVLYLAVALSITAVPVLISIVRDRGLTPTLPGTLSIAAATVVDVAGWSTLGVIVALHSGEGRSLAVTTTLTIGYVLLMFLVVRPALLWGARHGLCTPKWVGAVVALAMASAWATASLNLHTIFGAVLFGLVMPRRLDGTPAPAVLGPVDRAGELLMPIFFVTAGLSVDVSALRGGDLVLLAVVIALAMLGKVGGGTLASRAVGLSWRQSVAVGVCMNTRGLTELIVLNIGLQAGLIDASLYTVLVVMAVVTTLMTGPLLSLLRLPRPGQDPAADLDWVTATDQYATRTGDR